MVQTIRDLNPDDPQLMDIGGPRHSIWPLFNLAKFSTRWAASTAKEWDGS